MNIHVRHTLRMRIKEIERYLPHNTKREQKEMQLEINAHELAIKQLELIEKLNTTY